MNQVNGGSDMMLPHYSSVCGRAQERNNGYCLASGVLSGRKVSPSSPPDARHFHSSLYTTGALQAAALKLEPRESESM